LPLFGNNPPWHKTWKPFNPQVKINLKFRITSRKFPKLLQICLFPVPLTVINQRRNAKTMWFRVRASTALENPKHDGLRCNALVSQPRIAPEPGLRQTRRHVGSWQHSRRTHGWIATFSRRFRNWLVVCHSENYWISHSGATWSFFEESEIFGNEISWIVQTWNTGKSYHI
jgi:hypothetical protein